MEMVCFSPEISFDDQNTMYQFQAIGKEMKVRANELAG